MKENIVSENVYTTLRRYPDVDAAVNSSNVSKRIRVRYVALLGPTRTYDMHLLINNELL